MRTLAALSMTILIGSGCGVTIGQRNVLATRSAVLPPMVEGVTRSNVELVVDPGVTLRGWHLWRPNAPNAKRVVVFFHGNGAGILSSDWALHWFTTALDADVVAFDARGYGFSEGEAGAPQTVCTAQRQACR